MVLMVEQRGKTENMKKIKSPAIGFKSKFIPSERMPVLVEKLQKIEKKYPGEENTKIRDKKGLETYYMASLMNGFGGRIRQYAKPISLVGAIYFATLTGGNPWNAMATVAAVGFVSFCIASRMSIKQIKTEFETVKKKALERN